MTAALAKDSGAVLERVGELVSARASALDSGQTDVRADIAALGEEGLFDAGLAGTDLTPMVQVIERVAGSSLAVGFSAWAHRMTMEYLNLAPESLRAAYLPALGSGRRPGVTAMAAGLKQVAGLGEVPLRAETCRDGLRITGPIRWASNVFPDAVMVLPVRMADTSTHVVVVDVATPGVHIDKPPNLMALTATASTSLHLDGVHVPAEDVISTDLQGFVARIRPAFLLLQTAFCSGVSDAALHGAHTARGVCAGEFAMELKELTQRNRAQRERLYSYASTPSKSSTADLLRLRLDAAALAGEASRLEVTLAGGAGYALGTAANRRFREAAFLPIQSPSEGQLRWELTQYE
ncbi:acyl-CoA dehydrogenase [Mycobacterium sp. CBMA271]|uniref:acyl-CoA dehydrogenase family protein n=1 Tax=unclassified Mycobacteroides TaxID=2618759 RepID=UPI0012DCB619|nr:MULTISPECIES: acyl-CoA dehydrogenase family protein [unclassified Mycobacteroides]MUM17620.1 acyl-CoA dehydrogenase [Mycobacteroides sp. CBMA 326]MUM23105.1 acyl-CoA dehydrogenase [Mycobacteroides sp. CBMA 271]